MTLKKILKIIAMVIVYIAFAIMTASAIVNPTAINIISVVILISITVFIDSRNDWFILGFLARQDNYNFTDYIKGEEKNEDDSV